MLPVCSATPCCASHSQVSFPPGAAGGGGLRSFCPTFKDFESRFCIAEDRAVLGSFNGTHLQRISFKKQAAKSFHSSLVQGYQQSTSMGFIGDASYPNGVNDDGDWISSLGPTIDLHPIGEAKLNCMECYGLSAVDEGLVDPADNWTEATGQFVGAAEPETISATSTTPENPILESDSLALDNNSTVKSSFDDLFSGARDSIGISVNKGEDVVKSSLDTLTSSIASFKKSASDVVDNALSKVFLTVDQTGDLAGKRLTSFSQDLKEAAIKASVVFTDALRGAIVAVENSIGKGASFVVYSYGSAKDTLPPEFRDVLNLSEERAAPILRSISTALQQVYITIEWLEKSLGLNPDDPLVQFVVLVGASSALWVSYLAWVFGGYSGDLSPQSTLELLTGKENAVLIDVRPEDLRQRYGIPDLRRAARFRYASVTLPEVDGSLRKLLKGGRDLDDTLLAAVIRNLKAVQDSYKVIVMDDDSSRSKGIARSLRKLGVKRPYLVQGGFQSWMKQGLRIKELKAETTLTMLNEEAEAILEDINPSPVQVFGYGMGFAAACYAVLEWEKTLQLIGVIGLGQTIYRRVVSYEGPEDLKRDVRQLLAPFRLGAQAFSWAAGTLETNRIGLPTSPSSPDVQNRVLQAAAKLESQPIDTEGIQNPSPEAMSPINENVDLSEA